MDVTRPLTMLVAVLREAHRHVDGTEVAKKTCDLTVVDRFTMFPSTTVAQVSDPGGQGGVVTGVATALDVVRLDGGGDEHTVVATGVSPAVFEPDVGEYVVSGTWLGRVVEVSIDVDVLLADGSVFRVTKAGDKQLRVVSSHHQKNDFCPGDHVATDASVFKASRWIKGHRKPSRGEGTVAKVEMGGVLVYWVASPNIVSAPPPAYHPNPRNLTYFCSGGADHMSFWGVSNSCFFYREPSDDCCRAGRAKKKNNFWVWIKQRRRAGQGPTKLPMAVSNTDNNIHPSGGFMSYFSNQPQNSHLVGGAMHRSPLFNNNDESSPPQADIGNDSVRTEKRIMWTIDEDVRVMSAWIEHSTDSTVGADRAGGHYWGEVVDTYNKTTPPLRRRNQKQCKDRWHKINKWTDLFECAYVKARRVFTSGYNDQMWIDAAHKFYLDDNKDMVPPLGPYVLMEVWKICRDVPKWKTYNEDLKNARKRKSFHLEGDSQEDDKIPNEMPKRPIGQKAAKRAALAANGKLKGSRSSDDDTIYVWAFEDRMDLLRAVIVSATGTPYHDGLFFFDLQLPQSYPVTLPLVKYHSFGLCANPNLYASGTVCLSLLSTFGGNGVELWSPEVSSVLQVVISIQGLVLIAQPYYKETGYEVQVGTPEGRRNEMPYCENTYLVNLHTMLHLIRQPPVGFEAFIRDRFQRRGRHVIRACKTYMQEGCPVGTLDGEALAMEASREQLCSAGFKIALANVVPRLVEAFTGIGAQLGNEFDQK
ncbi:unnamed protein product [Urochloa decumbens]|uniref:UBC core domain-containing protein n=1 Tax=Urochloa decumbens TaxID=240449 RepID=A0ABC8VY32_9POAL